MSVVTLLLSLVLDASAAETEDLYHVGILAHTSVGPSVVSPGLEVIGRAPVGRVAVGASASVGAWPPNRYFGAGADLRLYPVPDLPLPYVAVGFEPVDIRMNTEYGSVARLGVDLCRSRFAVDASVGVGLGFDSGVRSYFLGGLGLGVNL
jgi:hypothetical protein